MAKLTILDHTGDTTLTYRQDDKASVQAAMDRFNELVKNQGHWAYKVERDGSKTAIKAFDETAEDTIIHPQMVGG